MLGHISSLGGGGTRWVSNSAQFAGAAVPADAAAAEGEVDQIPVGCAACRAAGAERLHVTTIPHFGEVVVRAFSCETCGYRTSEVPSSPFDPLPTAPSSLGAACRQPVQTLTPLAPPRQHFRCSRPAPAAAPQERASASRCAPRRRPTGTGLSSAHTRPLSPFPRRVPFSVPPPPPASPWSSGCGTPLPPFPQRPPPPPPSLRTNWTRLVPPSVLTGHVLSLPPY